LAIPNDFMNSFSSYSIAIADSLPTWLADRLVAFGYKCYLEPIDDSLAQYLPYLSNHG